jgi:two-component system cell cycle sensor histidine kinase/response regulator CckA
VTEHASDQPRLGPIDEPLLRAMARTRGAPTIFVRRDGTVLELNDATAKNLALAREQVLGRSLFELVPLMADVFRRRIEHVFDTGQSLEVEDAIPLPDGLRHFRSLLDPAFNDEGVVVAVRSLAFEVTAQNALIDALRQSDQRLALILEHSPYLVITVTRQGVIRYINRPGPNYSLADVMGADSHHFVRSDFHAGYDEVLRGVFEQGKEALFVFPDVHGSWWEATFAPISRDGEPPELALSFSVDVTDKRRAEEEQARLAAQMQQTQKLESLGVLAGGIAHDFNNLLLVISANAELAARRTGDALTQDHLSQVLEATTRAADLCRQMLAYAGRGKLQVEPVDLSRLVDEMAQLVAVSVSKGATLTRDLAPELPAIEGDAAQLRQVVLNLITNASDAIGAGSGTIRVCTRLLSSDALDRGESYLTAELDRGDYVALEVSDTGCGMDAATRSRLFEPFFSTKGSGRGLGLSATLGIIKGHRGAVFVESEPGVGTSIRIVFPAIAAAAARSTRGPAEREHAGAGTLLVVDDEDAVRRSLAAALGGSGYDVLSARDGHEGLRLFDEHRGGVQLVLLDLTMPGLSGLETLKALRERDATLPVILMSGYVESPPEGERVHFLAKPFRMHALLAAVQATLGARSAAHSAEST